MLAKLPGFEYRGPGSFLAWMGQVATFVVAERADYWRREKRNPGLERPLPEGGQSGNSDSSTGSAALHRRTPGPSTVAALAERRRRIAEALASLSDRHHTIVHWRFFGGAEWSEIAEEIGAPSADAVRMECYLKVFPALAKSSIRQVSLECIHSHVPPELMALLDGKDVLVGVIDVASEQVETPEEVAETIGRALQFVPKHRLYACTNCGLAPMPREVAQAKLRALAQGAALARSKLG